MIPLDRIFPLAVRSVKKRSAIVIQQGHCLLLEEQHLHRRKFLLLVVGSKLLQVELQDQSGGIWAARRLFGRRPQKKSKICRAKRLNASRLAAKKTTVAHG
jgi:hypothetical protein